MAVFALCCRRLKSQRLSGGGVPGRALPAVLEEARGQVPSLSYTATRERERAGEEKERERGRAGRGREGGRESESESAREKEREKESGRRTNTLGEEGGERASKTELPC